MTLRSMIDTAGDSISLLDCQFRGDARLDITASAPGSTCDLTGSTWDQSIDLLTFCGTVIGP